MPSSRVELWDCPPAAYAELADTYEHPDFTARRSAQTWMPRISAARWKVCNGSTTDSSDGILVCSAIKFVITDVLLGESERRWPPTRAEWRVGSGMASRPKVRKLRGRWGEFRLSLFRPAFSSGVWTAGFEQAPSAAFHRPQRSSGTIRHRSLGEVQTLHR